MPSRINLTTEIDIRGPLFSGRDGPIMRDFYADAKRIVGNAGVERVRDRLGRKAKEATGAFAGAVTVHDFAKGRTIQASYPEVLYGPWLEGTSTRNASTRFKGYRIFRLTRGWLRKNVGPLVEDRFRRALAQLGGGGR